jgi:hypothetical protein
VPAGVGMGQKYPYRPGLVRSNSFWGATTDPQATIDFWS